MWPLAARPQVPNKRAARRQDHRTAKAIGHEIPAVRHADHYPLYSMPVHSPNWTTGKLRHYRFLRRIDYLQRALQAAWLGSGMSQGTDLGKAKLTHRCLRARWPRHGQKKPAPVWPTVSTISARSKKRFLASQLVSATNRQPWHAAPCSVRSSSAVVGSWSAHTGSPEQRRSRPKADLRILTNRRVTSTRPPKVP
jgi:hypothetical protein